MSKQMSLEEYKKKVETYIQQSVNSKEATRLMKSYEQELKEFYSEKLETSVVGTLMLKGY